MATKDFTKGDRVTLIRDWNDKGAVYFNQAIVFSCGAKRMILTDEETGEELGRNYSPKLAANGALGTRPRVEGAELIAEAFAVAAASQARRIARFEDRATSPDVYPTAAANAVSARNETLRVLSQADCDAETEASVAARRAAR